jgi:hypothetical protein
MPRWCTSTGIPKSPRSASEFFSSSEESARQGTPRWTMPWPRSGMNRDDEGLLVDVHWHISSQVTKAVRCKAILPAQ